VWGAAGREPRLALRTGHADRLVTGRGRVTGVVVDGQTVDADLVIVAAGRASRFADETRPRGEGGACDSKPRSRIGAIAVTVLGGDMRVRASGCDTNPPISQ
jgi:2-polyprenyl-6-methoxyphenol hydroxylase-like FAD-dependent oxidoreductase